MKKSSIYTICILSLLSFQIVQAQENSDSGPSLEETIQYITNKVNGTRPYPDKGDASKHEHGGRIARHILKWDADQKQLTCNYVRSWRITMMADVEWYGWDHEVVTIPLSTCSSEVVTTEVVLAGSKYSAVIIKTTNGVFSMTNIKEVAMGSITQDPPPNDNDLFERNKSWGELKKIPCDPMNSYPIAVFENDPDLREARGLANALRHAIELCDGQKDWFAPATSQ